MPVDKIRILIIDDDAGLRKTLSDILRAKGYETFTAQDGGEGLSLLKGAPFNLVLIDLGLPDIPGLEVLEKVTADYPSAKAVILTGNATLDSAIEATNRGAFSYLLKPYDIDQMLIHIKRALEKQEVEAENARQSASLRKINAELNALYDLSLSASQTLDLRELLSNVLRSITKAEVFSLETKAAIFLADNGKLHLASFVGILETEVEPCLELSKGECLCGLAMETGEILVSKNSNEDPRHTLICPSGAGPHGHIVVPLKTSNKIIGVLSLYIKAGIDVREGQIKLLSSIGSQIAIAISNARLYEETKTSSLYDSLTGIANRRFMQIQLDKSLETAVRYNQELSVIMIDIDHFKNYNDQYGHSDGDRVLVTVAGILSKEVRRADCVFRYGGEEFLIILPETGASSASEVAERVRKAVERGTSVTISLGIASLPPSAIKMKEFVAYADKALYRAKQKGRNRMEIAVQEDFDQS
ncbi:MAG: diguanylate cyclase [Deltaproteobacteria bacterium]|nr:diguanylate cyclase [Deltaproteobacteria bacterium]